MQKKLPPTGQKGLRPARYQGEKHVAIEASGSPRNRDFGQSGGNAGNSTKGTSLELDVIAAIFVAMIGFAGGAGRVQIFRT
jgi:hypothetical protein